MRQTDYLQYSGLHCISIDFVEFTEKKRLTI